VATTTPVDMKLWLPQPLAPTQEFYVLTNATPSSVTPFVGTLNDVLLDASFVTSFPSFLQEFIEADPRLTNVILLTQIQGNAYKYSTTIPNDFTLQYVTNPVSEHVAFVVASVNGQTLLGASGVSAPLHA